MGPSKGSSAGTGRTGAYHRRRGRRSKRDCNLLSGRRSIWPQHSLDDAIGFPSDPIHVRAHRPSYRERTCRQHQDRFAPIILYGVVLLLLLLVANTLNIAADVAALAYRCWRALRANGR